VREPSSGTSTRTQPNGVTQTASCARRRPGGAAAEALQGEVDALEKQLAEEAELASATLDRAEAAERELASLRAQLEERQARPPRIA